MDVQLLGTGSAIPVADRCQTGILAEDGRPILIDCGSGVVHRLAQTIGVDAVETVLLTHHHLDHVADLPTLVKARHLRDDAPTRIVGPRGTHAVVEKLLQPDDLYDRASVSVREIAPPAFDLDGTEIRATETDHSAYCLAYRWGDRFAFSGDSAASEAVAELADGVDVLVHDCAYPDGTETEGHATPTALGQALSSQSIQHVYLTHFYPAAEKRLATMRESVQSHVDAEVHIAADRLTVGV
jgi:ribonuclease BN (tRNA processing enzyme)